METTNILLFIIAVELFIGLLAGFFGILIKLYQLWKEGKIFKGCFSK
jgi:hypothetical protein